MDRAELMGMLENEALASKARQASVELICFYLSLCREHRDGINKIEEVSLRKYA